ncbi:conserved domain protein [Trichinella spiralis]|uniref:hypothetical protein n=1 Tax=Trichinella spiralis TaxID=6334 RepID=UPI0001EFE404|nr:conserved domain protein [Trichinella spiralis]
MLLSVESGHLIVDVKQSNFDRQRAVQRRSTTVGGQNHESVCCVGLTVQRTGGSQQSRIGVNVEQLKRLRFRVGLLEKRIMDTSVGSRVRIVSLQVKQSGAWRQSAARRPRRRRKKTRPASRGPKTALRRQCHWARRRSIQQRSRRSVEPFAPQRRRRRENGPDRNEFQPAHLLPRATRSTRPWAPGSTMATILNR